MTNDRKKARVRRPARTEAGSDNQEIVSTVGHISDRDQEFRVGEMSEAGERWVGGTEEDRMRDMEDADEGDTGAVSDPAYEREGAARMLRSAAGDTSVEEHMTPAARAGEGDSADPRGIEHLTRDELRRRAQALNIPGRTKMTKAQLSAAVHSTMQH